jgi:hypothetical protein
MKTVEVRIIDQVGMSNERVLPYEVITRINDLHVTNGNSLFWGEIFVYASRGKNYFSKNYNELSGG